MDNDPDSSDLVTVPRACQIIGGDRAPIDPSTYYRGVKAGIYPPTIPVGPQAVRVSQKQLRPALRHLAESRRRSSTSDTA
jgi:hypothetical protein